MLLPVGPVWQ